MTVKTTTVTLTRASTHTADEITIVWDTGRYACTCTPDHPMIVEWDEADVWDPSSVGDWAWSSHRQCGNCGTLISPYNEVLVDATDDAIAAAQKAVADSRDAMVQRHTADAETAAAALLNDTLADLAQGVIDTDDLPSLSCITGAGVGVDHNRLEAIAYVAVTDEWVTADTQLTAAQEA